MSSSLPTLNDMLDPEKKQEPQKNPQSQKEESKPKEESEQEKISTPLQEVETIVMEKDSQEEAKQEEKKEEAQPSEEIKKEEKKEENAPPVEEIKLEENKEEIKKEKEDEPKVEEEKKKKKEIPKKPREPEPEIPSDFRELIKELKDMKNSGNDLFKKESFEEAISRYQEALEKLEPELPKINHERSYNPQSIELLTLYKQIMSNLSLCYSKKNKYQESIDLDLKIISIDQNYDKAYARLLNNYLNINKKEQAVYFGEILAKFHDETKEKYKKELTKLEEIKKKLQDEYNRKRAEERKIMLKKFAKYGLPLIVLIAAVAIYFYVFKKK